MRLGFKTSPQHTTWDAMLEAWRDIEVFETHPPCWSRWPPLCPICPDAWAAARPLIHTGRLPGGNG